MKSYIAPSLQIVSVNPFDIIATSASELSVQGNVFQGDITGSTEAARAPGRGSYDWDAGY
ncbi:MAG: hypothetical protein E7074_08045 [Bacteroidales bacterium]|nr:hypothetical protein [Bacteroidales bacterium]